MSKVGYAPIVCKGFQTLTKALTFWITWTKRKYCKWKEEPALCYEREVLLSLLLCCCVWSHIAANAC